VNHVRFWDPATGQQKRLWWAVGGGVGIHALVFSPDGKTLAAAAGHWVKRLDVKAGKERATFAKHATEVAAATFSHDGKRLASGDKKGQVYLWDAATGEVRITFPKFGPNSTTGLVFSADGQSLIAATYGDVYRWDLARGKEWVLLPGGGHYLVAAAMRADSKGRSRFLAGVHQHGEVFLWDENGKGEPRTIRFPAARYNACMTADGRHLLTANADGTVYVLRLAEAR
jgi:WD40 repeat protein